MPIIGVSGARLCRGDRFPIQGGQVPLIAGSGARYRGLRCSRGSFAQKIRRWLKGGYVAVMAGSGAQYMGVRCPLRASSRAELKIMPREALPFLISPSRVHWYTMSKQTAASVHW
jgi:hypothetical protein